MWAFFTAILSLVPTVLGWFGIGSKKSERTLGQETGERLGKLETSNAGLKDYIETSNDTNAARASVDDDPRSVYRDPDNRSNRDSPTG